MARIILYPSVITGWLITTRQIFGWSIADAAKLCGVTQEQLLALEAARDPVATMGHVLSSVSDHYCMHIWQNTREGMNHPLYELASKISHGQFAFGAYIRELREECGFSIEQVAVAIDLEPEDVVAIEYGEEIDHDEDFLGKLAKVFKVPFVDMALAFCPDFSDEEIDEYVRWRDAKRAREEAAQATGTEG